MFAVIQKRRGLGEIKGLRCQLQLNLKDRLKRFSVRLGREHIKDLVTMLSGGEERTGGFILVATGENLERLRVIYDPPARYQMTAAQDYLRGDIARVTGTAKSCNIFLTREGAAAFCQHLAATAARMDQWLELRARIIYRGSRNQRSLLEFIPDRDIEARFEEQRLGETGVALAGEVWTAEDFQDWEDPHA